MHQQNRVPWDGGQPDCVFVPSLGWWCRQCGVFRDVDDTDLCADCRRDRTLPTDVGAEKPRGARR